MGYNLNNVSAVRERFTNSRPEDRTNLLHFIFIQAQEQANSEIQRLVSGFLNDDAFELDPVQSDNNLDLILAFAENSMDLMRTSDRADRIMGNISVDEFYQREERYTELEKYLFKLIHNL
jgi:hypothetical protein